MIGGSIFLFVLLMLLTVYLIEYHSQRNVAAALEDDEQIVDGQESDLEGLNKKPVESDDVEEERITAPETEISGDKPGKDDIQDEEKKEEPSQEQEKNPPINNNFELKRDNKVYLTFDDGPGEATKYILQLLDRFNIKATFFMLEPMMRANQEVTKEIVKRGHQVGLHGVTHNKDKFYRSAVSSLQEMLVAQETLKNITGIHTNLVRVPYGSHPLLSQQSARNMEEADLKVWDWNVDSEDWKYPNGKFVQNTIQQIETFDKDEPIIVLLHDRLTTYNHLEELILYFIENGFEMDVLQEEMEPVRFFD